MSTPTPSSIPSCCTDTFHYPALKWRKIKSRISSSWKLSSLHSHNCYSSTLPFQTFVQIDLCTKVWKGSSRSRCLLRAKNSWAFSFLNSNRDAARSAVVLEETTWHSEKAKCAWCVWDPIFQINRCLLIKKNPASYFTSSKLCLSVSNDHFYCP